MSVERAFAALSLLFPFSEIALAILRRARPGSSTVHDRGSIVLLWVVIVASLGLAIVARDYRPTRFHGNVPFRHALALVLLAGGLALRWLSILTLGRFFTVNVAVSEDHRVIDHGPYRFVRHPSYTGLLLAFLGIGLGSGNGLSIVVLMVPITLAILRRIRVEEAALRRELGDAYEDYSRRTKRLIPGII